MRKALDGLVFLVALAPFCVGWVLGFVAKAFWLGALSGWRRLEE